MKNQFFFLLVNEKFDKHFSQLRAMHIMACIFLILYAVFILSNWRLNWMEAVALLPLTLAVLYLVIFRSTLVKQVQLNQVLRIFEIVFLSIAAAYFYKSGFTMPFVLYAGLAIVMLLLLVMETNLLAKKFIKLTVEEIIWPQLFYKRKIPWQNIRNVVLRFDVLTFEMKDNTFIQQNIFHKYDAEELALFDDFIKRQLK